MERVLNTLALNQLLSKKSHHLRNVLGTSLRSRVNHLNDRVILRQALDHLVIDVRSNRLQS